MRKHIHRLQTSTLLILSLFILAACGGGGSSSPVGGDNTDDNSNGDGTGSQITAMSIQLLQDGTDPDSDITSISESNPGVILVELTGDTAAITSQIITFSTTIGDLEQNTALTNSNGQTEVVITSGGANSAAGTISVSVDGLEAQSLNFEIVSDGTTNTAGFSIVAGLYDTDVNLDDLASSTQISSVSTVGSGFYVVTVTDAVSGLPVEGVIVSVSTTNGDLTPTSGQILTNSNGVAAAEVSSGTADAGAAATLTATIEDVSASLNFAFGSVDLQLGRDANDFVDPDDIDFVDGEIDIALTGELSSNGTTVLTVVVVPTADTTSGFDTPLTVNFSSNCSAAGTSAIDTGITTVNGVAQSTYSAQGCEGDDTITATIEELSGVTATGSLTVESPTANSVQFVSATPTDISLQGTGTDQSTLIFSVLDGAGDPLSGETVTMELSTTVGGISLTGDSDNDGVVTSDTNASGEVSVVVNAGAIPTSVRVEASIDVLGETLSTVSDSLVISTGLPDQNSFEAVASVLNPGGNEISGIQSIITVFASDAFNNPVPDGTTVNFVTEYGTIQPTCSTTGGTCTANWTSSDPRSPDNELNTGVVQTIFNTTCDLDGDGTPDQSFNGAPCLNDLSYQDTADLDNDGSTTDYIIRNVKGARSTILAYAIGEESFVDANGSGFYDWIDNGNGVYDGEPTDTLEEFVDLAEAFIDHNDDEVFGNPLTGCNAYDGDGDTDPATNITTPDECVGARTGGQEEEFVDFIDNDSFDVGNGIYNGTLCHPEVEAMGDCTTELLHVRDEVKVLVSGGTAYMAIYSNSAAFGGEASFGGFSVQASGSAAGGDVNLNTEFLRVVLSDLYNGYLPNGTTVSIETDNCTLTSLESYTIGNTNSDGIFSFFIGLRQDLEGEVDTGTVTLTATVPEAAGGTTPTSLSFTCNDDPVL